MVFFILSFWLTSEVETSLKLYKMCLCVDVPIHVLIKRFEKKSVHKNAFSCILCALFVERLYNVHSLLISVGSLC